MIFSLLRRPIGLLVCGLGIAGAAHLGASPPPPDSDLPVDPLITYGSLSNGVRFVLRPRTGSVGRISLRLVVDAGSLDETDAQRGLAHLLEHMAFNGSEHFPAGTIVEFLQRQGMALGADANANTTFDRTTYLLELRHNDAAALNQALEMFRDFSDGLLLPAAMVTKERGVVLSEKLARDSIAQRIQEAQMRFCLAGTIMPERLTIGDPQVIAHADRDQIKAFYDAWYRPDRITVVAVGDFDPAIVAAAIKARFGHLRAHGRPHAPPPFGTIANAAGLHVKYLGDHSVPGTAISFTVLHQGPAPADSAQTRLQELPRQMAFLMFNRRLSAIAARPNAPFVQGAAICAERLNLFQETGVGVAARSENWPAALTAAEHALRRTLQFGFEPAELRVACAVFAQQMEQAVRTAPSQGAGQIANALIDTLRSGESFVTPADLLSLYTPALSQMSVETCNAAFRSAWASPARFVTASGGLGRLADPDRALADAYRAAAAEPVAAGVTTEVPPWSYTDFGPPAGPSRQTLRPELSAILVQYPNGTRVNLKPTRFEADRVRIEVRVGTGLLEEPLRLPGLGLFAELSFLPGGLNRYRDTELQQVLAGKTVSLTFSVEDDAFQMLAVTNRQDLLVQLQWIAAALSDSAFRPEVETLVKSQVVGLYAQKVQTAPGLLVSLIPRLLASNDRRFGFPALRDVNRRNSAEVKAWLGTQLRTGPLEITIVGDFSADAALDALGKTVGALPQRHLPVPMDAQRLVSFPTPPLRWEETVQSEIPAAAVAAYWPTDVSTDEHLRDRMDILAAVLQDRMRLKLREQLGATYTPEAASYAPKAYPGFSYLRAQVTVDPSRADTAAAALAAIGASLASRTITADETERARLTLAERAHDIEHSNVYWLEALATAQAQPYTLDWARIHPTDFDAVTATELNALAATVFRPGNLCVAVIRPVKP